MDFGQALRLLKVGLKVSRDGWNGKNMWVAMSPGFKIGPDKVFSWPIKSTIMASGGVGNFRPYLTFRTANGEFVPWVASQTDLLAEDWVEVK